MQPRSFDRGLSELRATSTSFRLTYRIGAGHILHCDLWQESRTSRRPHVIWERIDTWAADSPTLVVRSIDDVLALGMEALMQQRLPGID